MPVQIPPQVPDLCTRIKNEYLEMPGLILTLPQAARLWDVDPLSCTCALDRLVGSGFLRRDGAAYLGADAWRRAA